MTTLSSFAKTIANLIDILESESKIATHWCKDNHLIVNPGIFQVIIFYRQKENHTNQIINIDQKEIKAVSKVKLLGNETDDKLNFDHHMNNICNPTSHRLIILIRLKYLLISRCL